MILCVCACVCMCVCVCVCVCVCCTCKYKNFISYLFLKYDADGSGYLDVQVKYLPSTLPSSRSPPLSTHIIDFSFSPPPAPPALSLSPLSLLFFSLSRSLARSLSLQLARTVSVSLALARSLARSLALSCSPLLSLALARSRSRAGALSLSPVTSSSLTLLRWNPHPCMIRKSRMRWKRWEWSCQMSLMCRDWCKNVSTRPIRNWDTNTHTFLHQGCKYLPQHRSHAYRLVFFFLHTCPQLNSFLVRAQMTSPETVSLIWKNSPAWLLRCSTCAFGCVCVCVCTNTHTWHVHIFTYVCVHARECINMPQMWIMDIIYLFYL